MKILAIGAHPDDIEIFMYGFLSACIDRGDIVRVSIATDGSKGDVKLKKNLAKIRYQETRNGLNEIGDPIMLGFEDGNLHKESGAKDKIQCLIKKINPDLILTHPPEDYHPDHRSLSNYIKDVVGFKCPLIFCETLLGIRFVPEFYVDITKYFLKKKKAILCHKSQKPKKFLEAVEIMNRFRAAQCNSPDGSYAETFRLDKSFPFCDVRDIIPPSFGCRPFYNNDKNSLI